MILTFGEFESRCKIGKDLELSPFYWNHILPETAPQYFTWFIMQMIENLLHDS